jgi:hypothetical protein
LKNLRQAARAAVIEGDEGVEDEWEELIIKHRAGETIAFIEKIW